MMCTGFIVVDMMKSITTVTRARVRYQLLSDPQIALKNERALFVHRRNGLHLDFYHTTNGEQFGRD